VGYKELRYRTQTIFDSISINIESMNVPKPRKYDIKKIINLIVKEFEGLRAAEVRVKQLLGIRIDHTFLHFWEKKHAHGGDSQCNFKRAS